LKGVQIYLSLNANFSSRYPNGIYAYFVGSNSNNDDVYPYVLGQSYFYGEPVTSNYEIEIGNNFPNETVITYFEYQESSSGKTKTTNNLLMSFIFIALFILKKYLNFFQ
jgi:hypothetical protein